MRAPFFANLDALILPGLDANRLSSPHALRWKQIAYVDPDSFGPQRDSEILTRLAGSLTTLVLKSARTVNFLPQLKCLTGLELHVRSYPWPLSTDVILAAFGCPLLTKLQLSAPLTSRHMAALLPRIPLLSDLTLSDMSELESLSFVSQCSAAHSALISFTMHRCRHRHLLASDVRHLYRLRCLTQLELVDSFGEPQDWSHCAFLFKSPLRVSPLLKRLQCCSVVRSDDEEDEDNEDQDRAEEEENDGAQTDDQDEDESEAEESID